MFKKIITSVTSSFAVAALLCNTLLYCSAAQAQEIYPNKPIKIVLGVPPGASTDFLAREVGRGLSERVKVPVVIENRAGANTIIGTNAVAKSAPDGYTLYLTTITTAINPFVYTNLPFDFKKDMRNIVLLGVADNVFAVTPKMGINNAQDMIAYAKKNPGQFTYGSSGIGSANHLFGELLKIDGQAKEHDHVPYQGSAPAMQDLMGGQIDGVFDPVTTNVAQLKAGSLRALGVSTPARLPTFPNIPTFAEQGFPSLAGSQWLGLSAPKGLPAPIAQRLTALVPEILAKSDIASRLIDLQTLPRKDPVTGDEFVRLIRSQISTWTAVAKRAKVEVIV
jgi:tripartite-type tricarboxylate transporter receptor subunit TctC